MGCPLTIVTPCLNAARYVAEAVDSVAAQLPKAAEHLVIDGGSGDCTLTILARYPHLNVLSRPDDGLYHALNDGLALARGAVIGFLNADDRYPPGALAAVLAAFDAAPEADTVCGEVAVYRDGALAQRRSLRRQAGWWLPGLMFGAPALNARFFRRDAVRRIGGFAPQFGLAADREWLLRAYRRRLAARWVDAETVHYRAHAGSATLAPGAAARPAIVAQHLSIAEAFAADPAIPDDERVVAAAWAAWERWRLAGSAVDRLGLAARGPRALAHALRLKRQVRASVELHRGAGAAG